MFKEIFTEKIANTDAKEVEEIFKGSKYDLKMISAIGNSGIDLVFGTKNKKDAENFDIKGVEKALKKFGVKLDKNSSDYPGGSMIQSDDWRKDGPNDEHEVYVSFKN